MIYMFPSFLLASLIVLALIMVVLMVMARSSQDREKMSPFECGFNPLSSSRLPFSLQFFLLAIIFLVFDIELALLMPLPILLPPYTPPLVTAILVIFILLLGLLHEWRQGSLRWA